MSSSDGHDSTLGEGVKLIGTLLAFMWGLEIVDQFLLEGSLDRYGIRPHDMDGLWGVLASPFLHGDFSHLMANSVPFAVLAFLVYARGLAQFLGASLLIIVLGGLGVWLFAGSGSIHIGASGLVFGYLGFLMLVGFFERSVLGILVSLAVGFLYGGILWGVLPGQPGISWQAHLFGFIAGVIAARVVSRGNKG